MFLLRFPYLLDEFTIAYTCTIGKSGECAPIHFLRKNSLPTQNAPNPIVEHSPSRQLLFLAEVA